MYGTVQDITSQKEGERERDELRRRLLQVHEQERLRLAHELHDQTGQSIAALMLDLKAIKSTIDQRERDRVRQVRGHLEEMGKSLHRMAFELRPASIDELGLSAALGTYISEWSARSGIRCDFQSDASHIDKLSEEIRTTLYRVVQEALTNVVKHAFGATMVSVNMNCNDSMLRMEIEDNGPGFDQAHQTTDARDSLGLAGMRERLSLINGTLQIESMSGIGTTIFVRIQLVPERVSA